MEDSKLSLIIVAAKDGDCLLEWAGQHRHSVNEQLSRHGAILFRRFAELDAESLERVAAQLGTTMFNNVEESSPRSRITDNVYTSTNYRSDESIFLHNENSYMKVFPLRLFFYCAQPSPQGGETPLADCRKVHQSLPPRIVERFMEKKWMYMRNYGTGIGMSWEEAFQARSRAEVEAYCEQADIECEWLSDKRLRTRQVREPVLRHPSTGELSWFNHLTFFHSSTLPPSVRDSLLSICEEDELPNNTYYGDGSEIEPEVLQEIRSAYQRQAVEFTWRRGDLLLVDNMLMAHSRKPFSGERQILFMQGDPVLRSELVVN